MKYKIAQIIIIAFVVVIACVMLLLAAQNQQKQKHHTQKHMNFTHWTSLMVKVDLFCMTFIKSSRKTLKAQIHMVTSLQPTTPQMARR